MNTYSIAEDREQLEDNISKWIRETSLDAAITAQQILILVNMLPDDIRENEEVNGLIKSANELTDAALSISNKFDNYINGLGKWANKVNERAN